MTSPADWLRERSFWQILGVYGAGAWFGFEAVATVTEALGLPVWVPRGALVLILAGLPFIAAAALLRREKGWLTFRSVLVLGAAAFVALIGAALLAPRVTGSPDAAAGAGTGSTVDAAHPAVADDPRPAIAVLPFVDMSPEGDQRYFSDGISEEILTALSRVRELRVAARATAFTYHGPDLDVREIGSRLEVPYVLAGTVRKDGDELRISAELVSASDGFRVWSETYDRRLTGIFAIQTDIAEAIAEALRVPLGLDPEGLVAATLDMEAHDLYLGGRHEMRRRGRGVALAIRSFEAAVARDSAWAPAWAGLAEAYAAYPLYADDGRETADSTVWANSLVAAETAARRALDLDPSNASARVALGSTFRDRWEWDAGERELRAALALDPDDAEAHVQYGELLWGMGRLDEALAETGWALALDRSPLTLDVHAFVLYMNGRPDEAELLLEEGIAADPEGDMHFLRTVLATQLLFQGRYREALDRFSPFLSDSAAYRLMGEAIERGDPSLVRDDGGRGTAQTLVITGAPDRALDVLEAMVLGTSFRVQYDVWDPYLEPIWTSRRFQEVILPRLHLEGRVVHTAGPASP